MENKRDKISDLPDVILHHIFSFLNMKEVVKTTFLSKRWRNLWISLPTLNFEYKDKILANKVEAIMRFIDKVFIFRDNSNIQRFRFTCGRQYIQSVVPVNTWIISALRRNVQELVLQIFFQCLPPLPTCLFNSKSLASLRLASCYTGSYFVLPIPNSVCLPGLKILFLETFNFVAECRINEFISSCPVLESLTITDCIFGHTDLLVSSLSLKHLVLETGSTFHMGLIEVMSVNTEGSVKLKTPNLISFRCVDYMQKTYYLEDISSLIKAEICLIQTKEIEEYNEEYMPPEVKKKRCAQRVLEFLEACRNVEDLTLSATILEVISDPSFLESNPTGFRNLRCLKMYASFSGDRFHAITWLLKMSPAVETLFVNRTQTKLGSESDLLHDMVTYQGEVSLPCLLDKLEHVEIRDAIGCGNELKILEILLKNAKLLKSLVAYTRSEDSVDRSVRMMKFTKLLKFPRASSNITILFI